MKILYATDLHGQSTKYNILSKVIDNHDILIIGADILPKHQSHYKFIEDQEEFMRGFLSDFFNSIEIPIIIDMGNDDCKCLQTDFLELISRFRHVYSSHLESFEINGVTFTGMHYVPDYPFGLKDWCRRDGFRISDPLQLGRPCTSYKYGFDYIDNLEEYLNKEDNIQRVLADLPRAKKSVFLSHTPPRTLGLDVCADFRSVGSESITNYIHMARPLISLHGHIHESPEKSGKWYNKLGDTICIQPGQIGGFKSLTYCEFDLNDVESTINRKTLTWKEVKDK